ncbi:hypothetical protein FHW23_000959 [Curtobacterium pusillum]|uniref:Bacterial Ig domain-containing protein n=1 Tax=Curtobacterium pusillum TaxID=69373 RepID=A0AAW3T5L9_9MICO|nr:hypothetical protein [Curtobacterium pusillum]
MAARTALIEGRATAGAKVVIDDRTEATVDANGKWSATVTKLKLGKNTVKLAEYKDGETEPSSTFDLEVELTVGELTGVVSLGGIDDLAKVSGKAQAGATVRLFDEAGKQIAETTASAEGTWAAEVPAPNAGGDYKITVAQFINDERNGDLDLTIGYGKGVEVTSPQDGDSHAGGAIDITGTGAAGAKVTVSEGRTVLGEATVLSNLRWSVEDIDLSNAEHKLTVTQKSKGANVTSQTITLNPGEGVVDLTAAGRFDAQDATKPATAYGSAPSGSTVVLRNSVGTEIGRTVAKDNSYTITIDPSKVTSGTNTFSVIIEGQSENAKSFTLNYGAPAADVVVTKPEKNGTVKPGRVEFAGTGQAGAKVVVRGSSREVASATVNGQGAWSATSTMELGAGQYDLYFDQVGKGGISKTIRHAFTIGESAPIVTPHTVTSPGEDEVVETLAPEFRGTGHEGATITVRGSSRVVATGTVQNGQWVAKTDAASPLAPGSYSLYVDQSIRGTVVSTIRASFTVSNEAFRELTLSSPAQGENVTVLRPTFVGTATPGAEIRVGSSRTTVATATVGQDGTFRATADFDLAKGGTYAGLEVKQTTKSGKTSTVSSTFTIDRNAQ